jgi:hypothetical protein
VVLKEAGPGPGALAVSAVGVVLKEAGLGPGALAAVDVLLMTEGGLVAVMAAPCEGGSIVLTPPALTHMHWMIPL